MTPRTKRLLSFAALGSLALALTVSPVWLSAQAPWPFAPPMTPDAQRNSLKQVQTQVAWLQNATRTAANYGAGGSDMLWRQFQGVCGSYGAFKGTLTPQQLDYGANDFAELDAGLDIIQEAFRAYQDDLANGRSPAASMRGLCRILNESIVLWLRELNQDCSRMRIGRL